MKCGLNFHNVCDISVKNIENNMVNNGRINEKC
jgi:hypothetical protein